MKPLSVRQEAILDYVRAYWRANGFAPSIREIMKGCGISSTFVASYNVTALVHAGLLRQEKGKARTIRET